MNSFDVPQSGQPLTALAGPVKDMARALNGLRNFSSEDFELHWDEGGAKLTRKSGSKGGAGGGLGPVVFAGTASGEIAYFIVNADSVAYSEPPAGYPIANPE